MAFSPTNATDLITELNVLKAELEAGELVSGKAEIAALTVIADTGAATAEVVGDKVNEIIAALKA